MAHTATSAPATMRGSAQSLVYRDEPDCSPPPYPYSDRQLPPCFLYHVDQPADDPPEYNFYDVERGSLIDRALAQYAQSISPSLASARYSILEQDEDAPVPSQSHSDRFRSFLFYCVAMLCGIVFAAFWICAIGYAIVVSFERVAQGLV
ncbi:hypothetical protein EPUS_06951 [Endocarpon pusillum Z07020]|uniref:Uncharacterized protein n=1 Tax=Endocarpon pusillum (strain Z07020 / HMAS-L-300199) TaxID=1263415 RepID=U1GV91_ENDPU|nr:uncharacterized protein EPUS_06951 [Endocarpon pusillum Z07020]ERF76393.1 hypothetical protein EPUS_06951 [Endocarpon pusillum Z07020]